MCQLNQGAVIAGSAARHMKTAAVGAVSITNIRATDVADNATGKAAANTILSKFESKFAEMGSKTRKTIS